MPTRRLLLAALLVPLAVARAASAQPSTRVEHAFVGVKKCASCHGKELIGDQVAAWRKDPHAAAFATLASERSLAIGREKGLSVPPQQAPECLACHVTAHGVAPESIAYELAPADGVQCESCHGPGKDYRKKKVMSEPEEAAAAGLWNAAEDGAICTACHNPASPTWDPARFTRPDGTTAPFDFDVAKAQHTHPIPEDVKGRYLELEKERKAAEDAAEGDE
jgi:hypothetical protein